MPKRKLTVSLEWRTTAFGTASMARIRRVSLARGRGPPPVGRVSHGGTTRETGVVDHRGAVFGYEGLYVADGSILPKLVGHNPSKAIAALSERIADGIVKGTARLAIGPRRSRLRLRLDESLRLTRDAIHDTELADGLGMTYTRGNRFSLRRPLFREICFVGHGIHQP